MTPETRNRAGFALTLALFVALCVFAWRSALVVYEEGPSLTVVAEGDAIVFEWTHAVEAPMAFRLRAAFGEVREKTDRIVIDLNSPGGALAEGRRVIEEIGRMKATHRVDTRVAPGAACASMCVPIFLAGQERIASPSSAFLFHEPTSVDFVTEEKVKKPAFEQRMDAERFFERYFTRSPMDPAWREKLRKDWKGRDVWKTGEELLAERSGVVTRLSEP